MGILSWLGFNERLTGRGHPDQAGRPDTLNRPLRELLEASGLDPDAEFPGFTTPAVVDAKDVQAVALAIANATAAAAQDAAVRDGVVRAETQAYADSGDALLAADVAALQVSQASGTVGYATRAAMDADLSKTDGTIAVVTNDPVTANNGSYRKTGAAGAGAWTPAVDRVASLEQRVDASRALELPDRLSSDGVSAVYTGAGPVHPIVTDAGGKVLLGFDASTGSVVGKDLVNDAGAAVVAREALADLGQADHTGAGPVYPIATDRAGRVLLGFDSATGRLVGLALAEEAQLIAADLNPLDEVLRPVARALNHLLFYGQSLAVGATGTPVLSLAQPYSNVTFNGGPRGNGDFGTLKPLVEDAISPAPDGGTNRGETPCSGAANYASTLGAIDGRAPADHVILGSSAGHGGYTIAQLQKASAWYATLLQHITAAHTINPDYALHALCWMQGENDAVAGTVTPYATYRAALAQLQADVEADAKTISGQASPVFLLTYQMSAYAATWPAIAKAQLDLAQKSDRFVLATPCYHLPFAADHTHLTNVGYKWIGAYFGRAYKHLVLDGKKPRWLNPVSATRRGSEIRVRMEVPVSPMVLDTTGLAVTTDHGFRVVDANGTVAISGIAIDGDDVVLSLGAAPVGATVVRYALDYLGAGISITNGASGNLRDSAPDVITISGVERPLFNVCPHFELTVVALGE